jgi:taurine transport system permease protein
MTRGAVPLMTVDHEAPSGIDDEVQSAVAVTIGTGHRSPLRTLGLTALSGLIVLGLWWLVSALDVWSDLILPSPAKVWDAFVYSLSSHDGRPGYFGAYLWEHLWASVWRIVHGVLRAAIIGVPLGIAIATWRPLAAMTEPWINFLRSLPPLAYFVLFIMWFGIGDSAKIWLLFGAAFPPIVIATIAGVQRVRRDRIDAARSLGASQFQVLRHTVLPSILPDLFVGLRVATGFAWTTIVAAETVNGLPGIGGMAWATRSQNRADIAIMSVIVIGITAVAMDQLIKLVERITVPWRGNQ